MNQRSNCQHLLDHRKRKRITEKNIHFCFIDYAKGFDCSVQFSSVTQSYPTLCDPMEGSTPIFPVHLIVWITIKLWKILQEIRTPDHLTCLRETFMQIKKQQLEPDMEQQTGSKLRKEHVKAVCCHPACLTSMQSTS